MDDHGSAHTSLFDNLTTEEVISKIVLTSIIVLVIAVLFVLILHLYVKNYWWRVDQQQQQEQQPSLTPSLLTRRQGRQFSFVPEQTSALNTGLTPSALSLLPIVVIRQESFKDGLECAVCLSELVNGEKARLLPKCNHRFHVDCIDMWFKSHSTCPICRNTVLKHEQESPRRVDSVSDNAAIASSTDPNDSLTENLIYAPTSSPESPNFPTNVLVWGSQDQISTGNNNAAPPEDAIGDFASRAQEAVVLEVNHLTNTSQNVSSSSSLMRFHAEEEEPKSMMTTRLRSLKRFLSRDKRMACSSSSSSNSGSSSSAAAAASAADV